MAESKKWKQNVAGSIKIKEHFDGIVGLELHHDLSLLLVGAQELRDFFCGLQLQRQAPDQTLKFGDTLAVLCGIRFFLKDGARPIAELFLPAREQGLTDLKLATNLGSAFLAAQDLRNCAGFLLGLERTMFFH